MTQLGSKIRVLLIDNEPSQLELISIAIGSRDKNIILDTVTSPEKALKLIHEQSYDCIVSDYIMPRMNGMELCERLRAEGYKTPFILFSNQDKEMVAKRAYEAGVDDFLENSSSLTIYDVLTQKIMNLVSKANPK